MSFKSIVRELKEMKDGIGNVSRRGSEGRRWRSRTRSHIAPDHAVPPLTSVEQGQWANLPPELLLDIIQRVEESETSWPSRAVVVFCASVCKSWREITKEIVKTPEQCGKLTFPISLKQVIVHVNLSYDGFYFVDFLPILSQLFFLTFDCLTNSQDLVNVQSSALSKGTELLLLICCTLVWFLVSLILLLSILLKKISAQCILKFSKSLEN